MSKYGITTKFGHKATSAHPGPLNTVLWFTFPNGFTASVIRESLTKDDLYELAVLKDGELTYSTPITGDVVRFATIKEITGLISRIAKL